MTEGSCWSMRRKTVPFSVEALRVVGGRDAGAMTDANSTEVMDSTGVMLLAPIVELRRQKGQTVSHTLVSAGASGTLTRVYQACGRSRRIATTFRSLVTVPMRPCHLRCCSSCWLPVRPRRWSSGGYLWIRAPVSTIRGDLARTCSLMAPHRFSGA